MVRRATPVLVFAGFVGLPILANTETNCSEDDLSPKDLDLERFVAKLLSEEQDEFKTEAEVMEAIEEYRRVLSLLQQFPDSPIVPSRKVDLVWHNHILDTKAYQQDMQRMMGHFIHHAPAFSEFGNDQDEKEVEQKRLQEEQKEMFENYEELFDEEPPASVWLTAGGRVRKECTAPGGKHCGRCGGGSRRSAPRRRQPTPPTPTPKPGPPAPPPLVTLPCVEGDVSQAWVFTGEDGGESGMLQPFLDETHCLDQSMRLVPCSSAVTLEWKFDSKIGTFETEDLEPCKTQTKKQKKCAKTCKKCRDDEIDDNCATCHAAKDCKTWAKKQTECEELGVFNGTCSPQCHMCLDVTSAGELTGSDCTPNGQKWTYDPTKKNPPSSVVHNGRCLQYPNSTTPAPVDPSNSTTPAAVDALSLV